ncbi:MAG: anthrone oxygenase family protein [Saprospiraceae bacterium]
MVFIINLWTLAYFVPMNKYFDSQDYEAETLRRLVKRWTTANHLRFVLLTVVLGLAIAAFEHYRG